MDNLLNIWEVRWFLYLLGFVFLPRINLLFIWYFHGGAFWDERWIVYVPGWLFMPRMMTGLIIAFTTQNYTTGAIMAVAGFFMDGGTKYTWYKRRGRKRRE